MPTDPKYNITTDKELLRFGADVINLEDRSTETYETDDFVDFVRFVKPLGYGTTFYSATGAHHLRGIGAPGEARNNDPIASVNLTTHPRLKTLIEINGKPQGLDAMEVILRKLKTNLDTDGIALLDNLADFKVAKVQKIERKKERNGNYKFNVSRESAGSGDFAPPETVKFRLPLFNGLPDTTAIPMEFRFEFTDRGDGVALHFTFENLNLDEVLLEARKAALGEALRGAEIAAFWGDVERRLDTNAWMYHRNAVER